MNAEEYLKQYQQGKRRLKQLQDKEQELFDLATGSPGAEIATINGERCIIPKTSGGIAGDRLERLIVDMATTSEEIQAERAEVFATLVDVTAIIDRVPIMEWREVLYMRYITGATYAEIARQLFMTEQTVYNYRRNGLSVVVQLLAEDGLL